MQIYIVFQRKMGYAGAVPLEDELVRGPYEAIRLEGNELLAYPTPDDNLNLAHYDGDLRRWITAGGEAWCSWYHFPAKHSPKEVVRQPRRQRVLLEEPDNG